MRLWLCVCFLFCAYSVSILIGEKSDVTYVVENEQEQYDLELNYSLCLSLAELVSSALFDRQSNRKTAELTVNDLLAKLSNSTELEKLRLLKKSRTSKRPNNYSDFDLRPSKDTIQIAEILQSTFARNDYYIHMNLICLIPYETELNQTVRFFNTIPREPPSVFIVRKRPFSFFKTDLNYQLLLLDNENYYSNCERQGHLRLSKVPYSRFECTNQCLKAKRNSAHYFYWADDARLAKLNFSQAPAAEQGRCFAACVEECKVDVFLPRHEIRKKVYVTELMISPFDYYVTFAGLISLFLNISIQEAVLGLTGPALLRLKPLIRNKIKHFNALFILFRISTLLICLLISSALYYRLIENFLSKSYDPTRKETTNALLEIRPTMHLVLCTPLVEYLLLEDEHTQKRRFNMTFKELEKATNSNLNIHLKGIYFSFLDEQQEVELVHSPKVFFWSGEKNLLRCFKIQANFKNESRLRFKSLLLISKVLVEFESEDDKVVGNVKLFLLGSSNESFTTQTVPFDGTAKLSQYQSQFSKMARKCVDYAYVNCTNRWNCIDVCVNRLFASNHSTLSIYSLIDKDQFDEKEWSSLKPDLTKGHYEEALETCKKQFKKPNCYDHSFKKSVHIGDRREKDSIQIDLHYELVNVIDEEQSIYKLALAILTIQSIFFGLNAHKLIMITVRFLQTKLDLNGNKVYRSLTYLICVLCLLCQSALIFVFIVDEQLTNNQYFERPVSIPMPEMVFCFRFERSLIDEHRRLTGNYLEEATGSLTASSIFESFAFLNASNEWVHLKMATFHSSNSQFHNQFSPHSGLAIRTAFFQNRKCFYFSLNESEYRMEQFYYLPNGKVLELQFTEKFKSEHKSIGPISFFLKQRGNYHFSKMLTLDWSSMNVVKQELFEILHQDRFGEIKRLFSDPLSLFQTSVNLNDVGEYMASLLGSFKRRLRMATTSWPLIERNELFDLPIENEVFDQYCKQVQEHLDKRSAKNSNYRRTFFINHFSAERTGKADFQFELLFFKKYLIVTNSENWPKLLISLLNVLSIWLNVSVFDLHPYFRKLTAPFRHLYRLLHWLQKFLLLHLHNEDTASSDLDS